MKYSMSCRTASLSSLRARNTIARSSGRAWTNVGRVAAGAYRRHASEESVLRGVSRGWDRLVGALNASKGSPPETRWAFLRHLGLVRDLHQRAIGRFEEILAAVDVREPVPGPSSEYLIAAELRAARLATTRGDQPDPFGEAGADAWDRWRQPPRRRTWPRRWPWKRQEPGHGDLGPDDDRYERRSTPFLRR